jgi:pimeloyl-ACP methyl ester carboxylesterase
LADGRFDPKLSVARENAPATESVTQRRRLMRLDDELITRCMFHPRPESRDYSPIGVPTLTQCNGEAVAGYLHESQESDALLIFFHGNGETAADYDPLAALFTSCGVSYWIVDYRGYGRSTGKPSFTSMIEDAEAILADVPRIGAAVQREFGPIIVMGRSIGSASAIHLASSRSAALAGLILDSPYADGLALTARLGGPQIAREEMPGFQDNIDKMHRCELPTLIIHGTDDQIIPLTDAEALAEACASKDIRIIKVHGAGHNNLLAVGYAEYCKELHDFLVRVTDSCSS